MLTEIFSEKKKMDFLQYNNIWTLIFFFFLFFFFLILISKRHVDASSACVYVCNVI